MQKTTLLQRELKEKAGTCKWVSEVSGLFGVFIHSFVKGVCSCWGGPAARGLAGCSGAVQGAAEAAPQGPHSVKRQKALTFLLRWLQVKCGGGGFVPFPEALGSHGL